jgi:hypothetical protein
MKWSLGAFARRLIVFVIVAIVAFALMSALAPTALADGGTVPVLPSLEQLLAMSLRALGAFACVALFSYYWGYLISALAARLPNANLPTWVFDLAVLIPTAGVAAAWNAFATYINGAFPGVLDQTVGAVLLYIANWLMSLFFSRRGGIAQVADLARLGISATKAVSGAAGVVSNARSGVLFVK